MIKHLILNNLILVESTEINFGPHFNVITGETGAGKTAIIGAIDLCLGARADSSLIRKGCDHAFVEVSFDIDTLPHVRYHLEEAGIHLSDPYLTIRREITRESKNRIFINCRTASLPLLQKIGSFLIDLIDQSAHHFLRKIESQRNFLDLYANTQQELIDYRHAFEEEKELQKKLTELKTLALKKQRQEDLLAFQIEEIESVGLKNKEEEALIEKHSRLANAQELHIKIATLIDGLSEGNHAILPQLHRLQKLCDSLKKEDSSLSAQKIALSEAHAILTEALHYFLSYQDSLDNPKELESLENRLNEISKLKRKYGNTFEEIDTFHQKIKEELSQLENLDETLHALNLKLEEAQLKTNQIAQELTQKRKIASQTFQEVLTDHLHTLNMAKAKVFIEITPQQRTVYGDDQVNFWLQANEGESPALVKEHSSGGEVSRLLFCIKLALAEKNNTSTLIFDEIDANVGGTTATIIGEKLKELGQCRQVICITHFPQVASCADTHFAVKKTEEKGRTLTQIHALNSCEKTEELLRMLGGKNVLQQSC